MLLSRKRSHAGPLRCGSQSHRREEPAPVFYVDGHRKPVYVNTLIPCGLIGRTGKILGCRALVVLHDQEGHPLLVTTHRGDQHLAIGLPAILAHYEQAAGMGHLKRIVVDREGLSAEFLAGLASARMHHVSRCRGLAVIRKTIERPYRK